MAFHAWNRNFVYEPGPSMDVIRSKGKPKMTTKEMLNSSKKTTEIRNMKSILSALWLFAMLT